VGAGPDPARIARAEEVADRLRDEGVEAVALAFVDPSAIVRVKCVPLSRYTAAARSGAGLSTVFAVGLSNDQFTTAPGYVEGPSGDLRLVPDPDATVPLVAMPGWAWAPIEQYTQEGEVWGACPRSFLRRTVEALDAEGLSVRAAFEFEFSLGRDGEDGEAIPAHHGPGYSDVVLAQHHELALDLIRAYQAQGLDVQQFHPEYTDGQFEASVAPRDPMAAADLVGLMKETTRAVAKRYGWRASFSPRTFGVVGNGMHLHLSLWDGDRNLMAGGDGPAGMDPRGAAFLAGIFDELAAITGVTCPSPLSYRRLQPHHWSGATLCWGLENREAALRFITGMTGTEDRAANVEVKPVDATCNPYLAMGALLAAGLDGVRRGAELPPPTVEDPGDLSADEQRARRMRQLPASLPEAIHELAASEVLRRAMGDLLFETFVATRRGDHEQYVEVEEDEMVRQYRWRY
jgi:glutamine synthetase